MKQLIILLFCCVISTTQAQFYSTYNWEPNPVHLELTPSEKEESSLGLLKKIIIEYKSNLSRYPRVFKTVHTIIKVNDENGINRHNTIYIPMNGVEKVVDIKARTINNEGKVVLLDTKNIKEIKNVEEYGDFRIFAIEGVEKGSEIEVLYTVEKEYSMYGVEWIQEDFKIKTAELLFITGDLSYNIKANRSYNTFETNNIQGTSLKQLVLKDIPAMVEEEYSTPRANKIAVTYQCFPAGVRLTQHDLWANVSKNIGEKVFVDKPSGKIRKEIEEIFNDKRGLSRLQQLLVLDNYVKSNYTVVQNNNDDLSDINYIISNRKASSIGIVKLYSQYLTALEIPFEVVITANRFRYKFDPDFFVPQMLQDFLIYIPSIEKYIAPDRLEGRIGEAPLNILGNYGLFIDHNNVYDLLKIVESEEDFSKIKRDIDIKLSKDFDYVTIMENQEYYGHWAETSRAILNLSSQESIDDYKNYLTASGIDDKEVIELNLFNKELNQEEYHVPFKVSSMIKSVSLLEDADDNYIFQIGKVIGKQSELYQETERINPIEMSYPNKYNYVIKMPIPQNYAMEGLESLVVQKRHLDSSGKLTAKFESNYTIENKTLIITIEEFYKTHEFEKNLYGSFREVINAASDFNKAAILFIPN